MKNEKSQNTSTIFLAPGQFFPKKGARLLKILYRQIGGTPKCVDIFHKKIYYNNSFNSAQKYPKIEIIRTMQGSILVYSDLKKSRTIQIFLDFSSFSALCKTK